MENKKWITVWGTAPSRPPITPAQYARDITLRYVITSTVRGERLRVTLSNTCGQEPVTVSKLTVAPVIRGGETNPSRCVALTVNGESRFVCPAGGDAVTDPVPFDVKAGDELAVSLYLGEMTRLGTGVRTVDTLSRRYFAVGNFAAEAVLPEEAQAPVELNYFLTGVDLYTDDGVRGIILYGDSITAQTWPEQMAGCLLDSGNDRVTVVRRAVSGSRVLRQYECAPYFHYGLSGKNRFRHECEMTAGADTVVVLHGINDIIHPTLDDSNPFRPAGDMPTADDLIDGLREYIRVAHELGLKIHLATLLPIQGWRTYAPFREEVRKAVNRWIRTNEEADGCLDFAAATLDPENPVALLPQFDSGDHLHPSRQGAAKLAECAYRCLIGGQTESAAKERA